MENKSSKPFYLQSEKNNLKVKITIGLILMVVALITPPLFLIVIIYMVYIAFEVKKNKSEEVVKFEEILRLYYIQSYDQCIVECNDYNYKDNLKVHIIKALCLYENKNYQEFINIINQINGIKLNEDIDILLKLAESYEHTGQTNDAKIIYKKLLKYQPKSQFLKDKIEQK
ncbi:tetratricopeptide repeat protein [Clostridium sp. YIM B02505]|uniref:Tetratricopeptide repeat protein n=1 Tax=Clostridium yunnanense TaxID=2800325 RepID=A0ABS1EPY1_9CLOT|nr:tetratricopeptide repeat protein [Clostridium yunnanense]MBK1811368.1 tetratricopeptide repeat protein [Clostridium yunnanense]